MTTVIADYAIDSIGEAANLLSTTNLYTTPGTLAVEGAAQVNLHGIVATINTEYLQYQDAVTVNAAPMVMEDSFNLYKDNAPGAAHRNHIRVAATPGPATSDVVGTPTRANSRE